MDTFSTGSGLQFLGWQIHFTACRLVPGLRFSLARPGGNECVYLCRSRYQTFGFLLLLVSGLELFLQTLPDAERNSGCLFSKSVLLNILVPLHNLVSISAEDEMRSSSSS